MEKNYMHPDSLVELEFLKENKRKMHYHENFELLYLMKGRLSVSVEEEVFQLDIGDMILINASRNHAYEGTGDVLAGRFSISHVKVRDLVGQNTVLFWCNSTAEKNEAYDDLRQVILKIFNQFLRGENGQIYLYSLYYQMLHILTTNFLLTAKDLRYKSEKGNTDDRMQEIFAYVRANYRENITLQDLSDHLYLSPTYLSKYIKKKCGVNFIELINTVRLGRAMEDLMYSDASVMKIAMDNGFANVAAYNKVFKEAYETTPSEFRKKMSVKWAEKNKEEEKKKLQIRKEVEGYLEQNYMPEDDKGKNSVEIRLDAEEKNYREEEKNCNRMINAGTALDLTKSLLQEQILSAKERVGFEYVRFWDIYEPELYIDIHAKPEDLYFGQLDGVIDFLVKNNLKPYIELGFKPLRVLKTTQETVKEIDREEKFVSEEEMHLFYDGLIRHLINRYGSESVKTWYFEYWEKETISGAAFVPMSETGHEAYFRRFDIIAGTFRQRLEEIKIGGGGFPFRHYGKSGFQKLLELWQGHPEHPDFISLTCFPYILEKEGNAYYEKRATDADFIMHSIEDAREIMNDSLFAAAELHVSEYSLSLSNRNAVNDSCIKGAFLMRNAIACAGKADMLGHWLFSDLYADFRDTQAPLFGGCGILTKTGITKPGFYAFEFFYRLYNKVAARNKYCLVTANKRGSFRLVCHNYKNLNYSYYMSEENTVGIKDIPNVTDDREPLTLYVRIAHMKPGKYIVKQEQVDRQYGSVQDEWSELNMEAELNMREQEYLQKISVPRLLIREEEAKDGILDVKLVLQPNEIQFVYITMR